MLRIVLIRHGSTDLIGRVLYGRMPGVHLSVEGRKQVLALTRALVTRYEFAEVVSSPMERALETARPIAEAALLDIAIDDAFNEIDFGAWIGKPFAELDQSDDWRNYCRHRATASPPGGESMMDVQSRAWKGIAAMIDRHRADRDATIAVVTHGDVIRAILMLALGMSIDHIHRLEAAPASLSELLIHGDEVQVRTMNETFPTTGISDI